MVRLPRPGGAPTHNPPCASAPFRSLVDVNLTVKLTHYLGGIFLGEGLAGMHTPNALSEKSCPHQPNLSKQSVNKFHFSTFW